MRILLILLLLTVTSHQSLANSWRQRASSYSDDVGVIRQRYKVDMNIEQAHTGGSLTAINYAASASMEQFTKDSIKDDEYMQEVYGSNRRNTGAGSIGISQTWNKLTDTRVMGAYSSDKVMRARTGGLGISRWVWHENLQIGFDVSRTIVEAPVFEVLGADSDVVAAPPLVTSTGTSLSTKMLATPTTVTLLNWSHIEKNDRPPTNIYSGGIKQFIPFTESAVHLDVARAFNRGRVTTESTYGEVDAWISDLAFLQSLWKDASVRLGYRYYKEDETTRVEGNEYVRGSDLISIGFAQRLTKRQIETLAAPVSLEVSAARYTTNELETGSKIAANIYEVGMSAQF